MKEASIINIFSTLSYLVPTIYYGVLHYSYIGSTSADFTNFSKNSGKCGVTSQR